MTGLSSFISCCERKTVSWENFSAPQNIFTRFQSYGATSGNGNWAQKLQAWITKSSELCRLSSALMALGVMQVFQGVTIDAKFITDYCEGKNRGFLLAIGARGSGCSRCSSPFASAKPGRDCRETSQETHVKKDRPSSLGQPIIRVNISTSKRSVVSSSLNVLPRGRLPLKTAATMAPALTTESSAEHRKRSLSSELCSVVNKLDPSSGDRRAAAEPAGPSKGPSPPPPTQTQLTNSDEEAAALKAADEVLGPNVDEILQVLESIESSDKCGGGSTSAEDSMLQRLLGSADLDLLAGAICGSQEQDADVAEVVTSPVPSPTPKVEERVAETSERQHVLERRCERLLRRVRKMQARGTSRHAAHQMQGRSRLMCAQWDLGHTSLVSRPGDVSEGATEGEERLSPLTRSFAAESHQGAVAGHGECQKHVCDSAGEPGAQDELVTGEVCQPGLGAGAEPRPGQQPACRRQLPQPQTAPHRGRAGLGRDSLQQCKRAAWRFAKERASVVSRWTWLQANIADLEYRIRQYTECHRSIRLNKGAVRLELPVAPAKPPQGEESMVVNGCHMEPPVPLEEQACARTRPLDTSTYRRRKIVAPGVLKPIYDQ
ncbi:hypothetical protein B566_EDAN002862, partial [Ephemera danica]